jgi:hypothetical protein
MTVPFTIVVPDYFNHLLAILGLLLVWKLHAIQVEVGRIEAVDFWDRSGIRLFIHVTPSDPQACPACQEANGLTLLPRIVAKKKFKALRQPCTNPNGCRCLLVGLYGGWPDAQRVLGRLRTHSGRLQLSSVELTQLLGGPWERYAGAAADRIPVHLLEAMLAEGKDPEAAIFRYRFVEEQAKRERDFPFVVHSFKRESDLLQKSGRLKEALDAVERFFRTYDAKKLSTNLSSESDLTTMTQRRTHLMQVLK